MQRCPGQDKYYWTPDDIFDVPCRVCDRPVEFMKTDSRRVCPHCGFAFVNPRLELGCAQWCSHALECLGFVPDKAAKESLDGPLLTQLTAAMKAEFGDDYRRIAHALTVHDYAEEITRAEGGDPRVVSAAALLHDIGTKEAERRYGSAAAAYQEREGPPIARRILQGLGWDAELIDHICRIVGSHHSGADIDTVEFRIVWDADLLANLQEGDLSTGETGDTERLVAMARTPTGRALMAQAMARKAVLA